jgi:hypothetical protein
MIDTRLKYSFSSAAHSIIYSFEKSRLPIKQSMLIFSNDIDVGSSKLGVINDGKRDMDVNLRLSEIEVGKIEEISIPLIVEAFDSFEVPMSFAVRGQLTEVHNEIFDLLLSSEINHDIGAHGYYHKQFTKITSDEAENELCKISDGMDKYGIKPRTFIFPRNCVYHLDLLEKYKYICYRGYGDLFKDRMHIEKSGRLFNVHPSICVNQYSSLFFLKKILDISIVKKLPLHIWFHFFDLGKNRKEVQLTTKKLFVPLLSYAKEKQNHGLLAFETMLSASRKIEI